MMIDTKSTADTEVFQGKYGKDSKQFECTGPGSCIRSRGEQNQRQESKYQNGLKVLI